MPKASMTRQEITRSLATSLALAGYDNASVSGIYPATGKEANWEADVVGRKGDAISPECLAEFAAVKWKLQRVFNLAE